MRRQKDKCPARQRACAQEEDRQNHQRRADVKDQSRQLSKIHKPAFARLQAQPVLVADGTRVTCCMPGAVSLNCGENQSWFDEKRRRARKLMLVIVLVID
jgi:hypothetical protein